MKLLLLTALLLTSLELTLAQNLTQKPHITDRLFPNRSLPYHLRAGQTYTQTFPVRAGQSVMQLRVKHRLSPIKVLKKSLPFLVGTGLGLLRQSSTTSFLERQQPANSLMPYVLGGAIASGTSFALSPKKKRVYVEITHYSQSGKVVSRVNQWIKPRKTTSILLVNPEDGSVEVSIKASPDEALRVEQLRVAAPPLDSSSGGHQSGTNYDDTGEEFYPDYGEVWTGYYLNDLWWSGMMSFAGYAYNNDAIYYSSGGYANGNYYPSGYYTDPSFTEPGGAGYYPMDNPGPSPVNGPGLYPASRQAEVYQYMWQHQSDRNVEQVALMTDKGIFLLPWSGSRNGPNTINTSEIYGFPGINIQNGYNGQKMFIYKGVEYRIEGIVHTHPPASRFPQGDDGASSSDRNVANDFKAPNFVIADEGIWRIRPGGSPPGELIYSDYLKILTKITPSATYTATNSHLCIYLILYDQQ